MAVSDDKVDEKQKRVIETIINHYHDKITQSIEENLKISFSGISRKNIIGFLKHTGAGGVTYILTADFISNLNQKVRGGIVVKFANDLNVDIQNATDLNLLLQKRQIEWNQYPPSKPLPDMPHTVFSPAVLGTHPSQNVIILEFINDGVPLMHSEFTESKKNQILGYALARLHGSKSYKTDMRLYEPVFRLLETYFNQENEVAIIYQWKDWISNSMGGAEYIHGDSHLDNIMFSRSSNSLAWIDALLIPNGERFDDLTYAMSHIVQERMISMINENPNLSSKELITIIIREVAGTIVPQMLSAYMRTAHISGLYKKVIPLDFFLGFHLIIRSQMFPDSLLEKVLVSMGRELILERPLVKTLGLEKKE
ncbi:MAG: hypothetical protein ACFFD1_05735 [Candidatus Thorarchaeota archaeon]